MRSFPIGAPPHLRARAILPATLLLVAGGLVAAESPLSPSAAIAGFQLEPGLRVELVAAEPDVIDPVAMAFDEHGLLFVVEGHGYPTDEARGVIAVLADADGDGRFERRSEFASGLRFPNGVLPWKDGVFVTDAPDVLYLSDTDGDGRADLRDVILTGFAVNRTTQLRVNDPTLGLDGWMYLAGGLSGGKVTSPHQPDRPAADLSHADLRFHPETGIFEPTDSKSQFGLSFDDFGRRFLCMNRIQARHVVIESRHLRRNPRLAFSSTLQDLPEERVEDLLRGTNVAARVYPASDNLTTADSHAGTFSAACAVTIWRGGALPERHVGQVFSCDPTGNLIHRDALIPRGATFIARRSSQKREFLASPDNWFRPVFLAGGPDGALYVCDMYRKMIEHPQYLPEEVRKRADFSSGRDRGRIYRIVAQAARRNLRSSGTNIVDKPLAALEDDNAWVRDTAFRLLVERSSRPSSGDTAPALRRVLAQSDRAAAQTMALRLLENLGVLKPADLLVGLRSRHAGVRENALELAEPRLAGDETLATTVIALADDSDARVRFRCALSLGALGTARIVAPLATIAIRDAGDRWARAAIISSAAGRELALVEGVLDAQPTATVAGLSAFVHTATRAAAGSASREATRAFLARLVELGGAVRDVLQLAVFNGLAQGGLKPADPVFSGAVGTHITALRATATRLASDAGPSPEDRVAAVEFIGNSGPDTAIETLVALVRGQHSRALQLAAVGALGRTSPQQSPDAGDLLELWQGASVSVREAILGTFLSRVAFAGRFVDALEDGAVPATVIAPGAREKLLKHTDATLRSRAKKFLASVGGDRMKVFEKLKTTLSEPADPNNGRELFKKLCATCHRLDREGVNVGPDLFGMRNQPKETILLHVIVPNREIAPGFEAYAVVTTAGEPLHGLVTSETATSVTLLLTGALKRTLLRSEIASIIVSPVSLMPDGVEASISQQDVADLIAYLKGET